LAVYPVINIPLSLLLAVFATATFFWDDTIVLCFAALLAAQHECTVSFWKVDSTFCNQVKTSSIFSGPSHDDWW
jgi:hypothetical protein